MASRRWNAVARALDHHEAMETIEGYVMSSPEPGGGSTRISVWNRHGQMTTLGTIREGEAFTLALAMAERAAG